MTSERTPDVDTLRAEVAKDIVATNSSRQEPTATKTRDLPVLLKPDEAQHSAPERAATSGTLGIQTDLNATVFVDNRQVGYTLAGDPYWTNVAAGTHTLRVETDGSPGCPLIKELAVSTPMDFAKIVSLASGTLKINGRIPAGTLVKLSSASPDIRIGSGCELLVAPFTYRLLAGYYLVETMVDGQLHERKNLTLNPGAVVSLTFQ
jgi:hypothetical protein